MAAYRIYPHRTAPSEAVEVQWWVERAGQRFVCPDLLTGWDYDSPLTVGMTLTIDSDDVLRSTGISSRGSLSAVLQVECRSAQARFSEQVSFPETTESVEVRITMPPGSVAGSFVMSGHVVLGEEGISGADRRVAVRQGARLLSGPSHSVVLEGDAGRFPTEAVSFAELGLRDTPWTISLTHEDMGDSFMGTVRLLINSDHAVAQRGLNTEDSERFVDVMTADLIRLLVAGLSRETVAPEHRDNEESLANVMDSMCETFLNCSFEEARGMFLSDPVTFDAMVQQEVNPLQRFVS